MIVTDQKLEANRRNAAQSTGPVTAEGKSRSASNSTKAGWFARELHIRPEDAGRYAAFRQSCLDSLQPAGQLESDFFEDYVRSTWRKNEVIDALNFLSESADPLIFLDPNAQPQLDRLHHCEARFERRAQRAIAELRRLQTARAIARLQANEEEAAGAAAPPPLADPAKVIAVKRTQIALNRDAAITPDLRRTLAIMAAESERLNARARAHSAGLPAEESEKTAA